MFILYQCLYEFMQPFIVVEITERLRARAYGAVLSVGTACGVVLQVILQVSFVHYFDVSLLIMIIVDFGACCGFAFIDGKQISFFVSRSAQHRIVHNCGFFVASKVRVTV